MTEHPAPATPEADTTLRLVASALHKIDTGGSRGITMVTFQEIDAMATLLLIQAAELTALNTKLAEKQEGLTQ